LLLAKIASGDAIFENNTIMWLKKVKLFSQAKKFGAFSLQLYNV
jgi:hypothetical protein